MMTKINWILSEGCAASKELEELVEKLDIPIEEITVEASFYKSPIPLSPGKLARKTVVYKLDIKNSNKEIIGFQGEEGDSFYEEDLEQALINLWLKSFKYNLEDIKRLEDKLPWEPPKEAFYQGLCETGTYNLFPANLSKYSGRGWSNVEKDWFVLRVHDGNKGFYIVKTPEPIKVLCIQDMQLLAERNKQEALTNFLQELKTKYVGWTIKDISLDSVTITNGEQETFIECDSWYDGEYDCQREVPLIVGGTVLQFPDEYRY